MQKIVTKFIKLKLSANDHDAIDRARMSPYRVSLKGVIEDLINKAYNMGLEDGKREREL